MVRAHAAAPTFYGDDMKYVGIWLVVFFTSVGLLTLSGCGDGSYYEHQCNDEQVYAVQEAVSYCINHPTVDNRIDRCVSDARNMFCNYVKVNPK